MGSQRAAAWLPESHSHCLTVIVSCQRSVMEVSNADQSPAMNITAESGAETCEVGMPRDMLSYIMPCRCAYKHQSCIQVLGVVMHVLTVSALSVSRYPRLHAMQTAAFTVSQVD
jgi:hypothetical protein